MSGSYRSTVLQLSLYCGGVPLAVLETYDNAIQQSDVVDFTSFIGSQGAAHTLETLVVAASGTALALILSQVFRSKIQRVIASDKEE